MQLVCVCMGVCVYVCMCACVCMCVYVCVKFSFLLARLVLVLRDLCHFPWHSSQPHLFVPLHHLFCGDVFVRYLTDVLACSVVSDLVVPFVRFAVKCLKAGVFNDNLIATCEKALNRFSTVYQRHALTAKVRARLNCGRDEPGMLLSWHGRYLRVFLLFPRRSSRGWRGRLL